MRKGVTSARAQWVRRGDGRWEAKVRLGFDLNGRPVRRHFYGKTQRAAVEKMQRAIQEFQHGLPVTTTRKTIEQFLVEWLENTAKPRLKPRTYADYKIVVDKHLVPALGRYQLKELAPQHVQALIAAKAETFSARRVAIIRAVLRTALNDAAKWNLVVRNVATLVTLPRPVRYEAKVFDKNQARRFIKAAQSHRLGPLFTVGLTVGLRLGEALALTWEDVDLKEGRIAVRRTLQRVNGELVFGEPKSRRSIRTVRLPTAAINALKRHRARQRKERFAAGAGWCESGLLFTSTVGTPLDDRNVRRAFHEILQTAKLPRIRIHDLRHTCATLLLVQGVHIKTVQEILGHSQATLTLDTYSHILPSVQEDAAQQMDAALGT